MNYVDLDGIERAMVFTWYMIAFLGVAIPLCWLSERPWFRRLIDRFYP